MEKDKKLRGSYRGSIKASNVHEPAQSLIPAKKYFIVKDLLFKDFKKMADKTSLTQQEWSDILHISERTLQRYSKTNSAFSFSVADRILQIEKVLKKGSGVFGTSERFLSWLRSMPVMPEGQLSLQSLAAFEGISLVLRQLGRIEHGIFA